jgi:hypothetical protein
LHAIGAENNSTVVFPLPLDLVRPFLDSKNEGTREESGSATPVASEPLPNGLDIRPPFSPPIAR